jgi:hypothetical protein
VQRCKSAYGLCKSEKVKQEYGVQSTEYGVRSAGEQSTSGRDAVAPLPAGGAREGQLGWHAVPTLPDTGDDAERRDKRAEAAVEGAG